MVTTSIGRPFAGDQLRLQRAAAITEQNLALLLSSRGYWWLILSGLGEPVFDLLAIGWAVGALVGHIRLADGHAVPYLVYLAPALLAASAMSGALVESGGNFFLKMKQMRIYDSVLSTPVTPVDIAFGELAWAMVRGTIYSAAFLVMMVVMGLTRPWLALAALPAVLLVGLTFSGLGLIVATVMRTFADYNFVGLVQTAVYLLSGTFVPVTTYPVAAQVIVQITPLYHAVELLRGIILGQGGWGLVWHSVYLTAVAGASLVVASRRLSRKFRE